MTGDGTLRVVDKRSLAHIAGRFRDAQTRTEVLREELAAAIRAATKDGVPQKEICEVTGYTRQQIRRITLAEEAESDAPPS